ncbi:glycosyltransferase family 4 protein [Spirosoma rhododendri]|uniref:Glycosyltransferase family 4 protein n=1 Tax=Spirosoma rhododendri TaxID=2728024 RepID=A0A7L5DQV9_9BACT|nr:glycosyltransferase family 1 protein [Spirosoma rhododendri]QJD80796.1 glycosyltransferase family 4 protein [Spirosoma rhododendri]
MNITVDASPLGIGFYHRQAQTGVSRVVEKLVAGLHRDPSVRLTLAAPTHLSGTMRYADTTFGAQAPPFVNRPVEQRLARVENGLLSPFVWNSMPSKLIREGFYRMRRQLDMETARFDERQFAEQAIYHSPFYAIPPEIGASKRIKKLLTVHDLIPVRHPEWFPDGERAVRQVLETLPPDAFVTTVSEATKVDFCEYTGFDPARVTPIRLAASPDLFYPATDESRQQAVRQKLGLGDGPYLLSLATLEPRKNIDHLLRCFVNLVEAGELPDELNLVLVGAKGWKLDALLAEIARHDRIRNRLVFTGFVADDDLAPLYTGALAFVYPSLYEGFGLPPLEAMQCGLPVITSNVSSLPEVVGDAALLVPPTDAAALSQALLTVVNSATVRADLSARSLARARLFSWEKFSQEHIALYKTIA